MPDSSSSTVASGVAPAKEVGAIGHSASPALSGPAASHTRPSLLVPQSRSFSLQRVAPVAYTAIAAVAKELDDPAPARAASMRSPDATPADGTGHLGQSSFPHRCIQPRSRPCWRVVGSPCPSKDRPGEPAATHVQRAHSDGNNIVTRRRCR